MAVYTPETLAEASACFCFDPVTAEKVKIYLLAVVAGLDDMTPAELAEAAKCFCFDRITAKKVEAYLEAYFISQTQVTKGDGPPVDPPATTAALYYDTNPAADPVLYWWNGTAWIPFG